MIHEWLIRTFGSWAVTFPEEIRIPLASWIDTAVDWVADVGQPVFDAIGQWLVRLLVYMERLLQWPPWWFIVLILAVLGWRLGGRSWRRGSAKMALGIALGMVAIGAFGLWTAAMNTLSLVLAATLLAMVVGIPAGILMGRSDTLERVLRPALDMMQTLPSFVYLIPVLMVFPLGKVPALIATFIYALPPVIRLTSLGLRQVSDEVVEAALAFGSTSWQLLLRVQIPLAMPAIMAGINQTIMMALAMVVIASMIGAGGVGSEVLRGIARLEVGRGFQAGITIVIMAIVIDRLTQTLARSERKAA